MQSINWHYCAHHDRYRVYQREVEIALFAGSLASSMASISAGSHVQPPPPSPPGHDPRTSSIQALRMRAKEHVESITKGLQMVWRLTEDTPRARTAASRIGFTLVTAWRATEPSFAQRRLRSRGVAWAARTIHISTDEREREGGLFRERRRRKKNHRRCWTWRKYKKLGKRTGRSVVCVGEWTWLKRVRGRQPIINGRTNVHCWYVKSKRLILQQSTIGGYIFDDYKDYRCDNWQVSMINEHVLMLESGFHHWVLWKRYQGKLSRSSETAWKA